MHKSNTISQQQTFLIRHVRALLAFIRRLFTTHEVSEAQTTKEASLKSSLSLDERIPPGSWDSHMHVVNPELYPLTSDALYRPKTHTLENALSFESSVALDNITLVQPSIYGNDNRCMLDALKVLGGQRGRAVVGFEPQSVPVDTLKKWHELGVRGVRINFSSVGKSVCASDLRDLLHRYAEDCRPQGWIIQVYMPMDMIPLLEPIVPELGVRVCIDHMGHPCLENITSGDPYQVRGFKSLINLLESGSTYVKFSAPYRLSSEASYRDLEPVAREILKVAGKTRVVFATDWPHTRFEGLDIRPWMERVLEWCGDDDLLVERLFKGNAEDLWH
ncbi:putative TIM barrel metal-dependent hydrolase [Plectosphaerella plurivora]|uniref:TIM barrel metal-dependent hydrolase n=1 Tax=Plectosphaerella plurivora TaxID=936078 RepID=A0A9P8VIW6_9PEZI|nr:putative TIM barrel metal-dependent hydrolase [Plectosphaerella plurivora]